MSGVHESIVPSGSPGIRWSSGVSEGLCPVCLNASPKRSVLSAQRLGDPTATITLLACLDCGVMFDPELAPALYVDQSHEHSLLGFELGYGFHGSVECLAMVDTSNVTRFVEIGCGTGLTLDFGRHVFGWDVLGIDDSGWSALAPELLDVPVVVGLLGSTPISGRSADLVFACEVIEHVADQHHFVAAVLDILTDQGVFLLRTPNSELITPDRSPSTLKAMVSAGLHVVLHTETSLERTLRDAGFEHVRIVAIDNTLFAAASRVPFDWHPQGSLDREVIEQYFVDRCRELSLASAARIGLLQQMVDLRLAQARVDEATVALDDLRASVTALHGGNTPAAVEAHASYAAGSIAAARGHFADAAAAFDTARLSGAAALEDLDRVGSFDEAISWKSVHADALRILFGAVGHPTFEASTLEHVLDTAAGWRTIIVFDVFLRATGIGADQVAHALVVHVREAIDAIGPNEMTFIAREARWSLGMHLLYRDGRPIDAADVFADFVADPGIRVERSRAARLVQSAALIAGGRSQPAHEILTTLRAELDADEVGDASMTAEIDAMLAEPHAM